MKYLIQSPIQTDHFTSHRALLPVYEKLFSAIKDATNSVLEIGTNDGGGIKMYSDYFPDAKSFGMDILPTPQALKNEPRIQHFSRNAYTSESVELMRKLGDKFAMIVDDGSHELKDQIWFCKNYPALLTPDGLAIVEDIQDAKYLKPLSDAVLPGYCGMAIDMRHVNNRFDDLIFVIWRNR
jgi:hypothetical protein